MGRSSRCIPVESWIQSSPSARCSFFERSYHRQACFLLPIAHRASLIPFLDSGIIAIYTSDLKRARTTAQNIFDANQTYPSPPFTVSPILREQFFGEAEGTPWNGGAYSSAGLPWEDHRSFRLAEKAESLAEVGARADQGIITYSLHRNRLD